MEAFTYRLDDFEGPLDLLLHLVRKNKMDLGEIPILVLIDQYTRFIEAVQENRLEIASEFIEMAAQLVQMKSFLLLPRSPEAERMAAELQGRLIEYSAAKEMAIKLGNRAKGIDPFVREAQKPQEPFVYDRPHDAALLFACMQALAGRAADNRQAASRDTFEPLVAAPFVTVASRVVYVLKNLVRGRVRALAELFAPGAPRSENVATFLALLELMRAGRVSIASGEELTVNTGKLAEKTEAEEWN